MRYFRVEGEAITELDRLGTVRAPLVKGALAGAMRPRWRKSRKKSGEPAVQPASGLGQSPVTGSSVREPVPVRYLRRCAAEMKCKQEEQAAAPGQGSDTTDSGKTTSGRTDPPS